MWKVGHTAPISLQGCDRRKSLTWIVASSRDQGDWSDKSSARIKIRAEDDWPSRVLETGRPESNRRMTNACRCLKPVARSTRADRRSHGSVDENGHKAREPVAK